MKRIFLKALKYILFIVLSAIKPFAFILTVATIAIASFFRIFCMILGADEYISIQAMCYVIIGANAFYFLINFATELLRPGVYHS